MVCRSDCPAPSSRDSVAAGAISCIVNAVIYLWLKPAVAVYSPLARPLIRSGIWLNVVSLGLILCSAWWWAKWQNRLPLVLRLDLASSLILLALFWWTSQPRSSGQDYVGVV